MSQGIDAVKRLERAGEANLKATSELIEAADRLAHVIVDQYDARDKYIANLAPRFAGRRYSILNGRLVNEESRYVADNRDAALAFAQDAAGGLLTAIADDLEERNAESGAALAAVRGATRRFR